MTSWYGCAPYAWAKAAPAGRKLPFRGYQHPADFRAGEVPAEWP
jgi:hypothetical protein